MSLPVLDFIYTLVHLLIIGFNLFAWAFRATRRLHLYGVAVTLACWLILGIWYGIGYCPVTDWQWQVKARLGEQNLPNSFVKYYADKISGRSVDANLIDIITAGSFLLSIIISVYLNFFSKKSKLKAKSN
ncbi:Protein of Unknown function [Pedobacter steynii]|uniref:DUF2784 domain-containing protein n=1 Tax=Pedobacter steynii TaxID=430522 RepID=A0A1H0CA15_9SPHI|nr:DUF2784 domain-containing protein [Pedobacter steynii]NQX41509.1 DUF2784 domain-containing protein [Pedobacter steynii]SDN54725.1 Protein of Unknown function [Pedobacter steynii]